MVGQHHLRQPVLGRHDARGELGVGGGVLRLEPGRVGLEGQPATDHLGPLARVAGRRDLHGEPEAVEQLRAQLALLGVHRAHEQEPGGVADGHAFALDVGRAERRGVQEQVDQVVVQQVDLVDVEHAAVRAGEQSGLIRRDARGQRLLEVERADEAVLARTDRQLHEPSRTAGGGGIGVRTVGALRVGRRRVAGEPAARDDRHGRQQGGQSTDDGGLGRALLAAHEDAADGRRHGVDDQSQAQVVEADDGREGVRAHSRAFLRGPRPGWTVRQRKCLAPPPDRSGPIPRA